MRRTTTVFLAASRQQRTPVHASRDRRQHDTVGDISRARRDEAEKSRFCRDKELQRDFQARRARWMVIDELPMEKTGDRWGMSPFLFPDGVDAIRLLRRRYPSWSTPEPRTVPDTYVFRWLHALSRLMGDFTLKDGKAHA